MNDGAGHRRPEAGWQGRLTSTLMGAAGGVAVTDLSTTLGYRGLAGAAAVSGVVAATTWVRGLVARVWLPRHASWLLLTPAAAAAIAAAFLPWPGGGILTLVTVVLTAGAVLLATSLEAATFLWTGAAAIGLGVAAIGIGVAVLADRQVLFGVAVIGVGVAAIGLGVAELADRQALFGVAVIGVGVAAIGGGVAVLADRQVLFGVALIGGGIAVIGPAGVMSGGRGL